MSTRARPMPGSFSEILTSRKRVNSAALNLLGIQALRVILARGMLAVRGRPVGAESREPYRLLVEQGFCTLPDFLPRAQFDQIRAEAKHELDEAMSTCRRHGFRVDSNRFARVRIELLERDQCGVVARPNHATKMAVPLMAGDDRLLQIMASHQGMASVEALMAKGRFALTLERLFLFEEGRLGVVSELSDHELHADTFHTITKAFLFLQDTDDTNGPFVFVPGSHRVTARRLLFDYRHSLSPDGVLRYRSSAADLRRLGGQARSLCVAANTLVIANTQGIHARGNVDPGAHRDTICLQYRPTHIL